MAAVVKVWSSCRTTRHAFAIDQTTIQELTRKARLKFGLPEDETKKFVLEADGSLVEEDAVLAHFVRETLILLRSDEKWKSEQSQTDTGTSNNEDKLQELLQRIRQEKGRHNPSTNQHKGSRKSIKLYCGWFHYDSISRKYVQLRSTTGGGLRAFEVLSSAGMTEITQLAKEAFFPQGKSAKGRISKMDCYMANYGGDRIEGEGFTASRFVNEICPTTKPRLYLYTKRKCIDLSLPIKVSSSSGSSDDGLPDISESVAPKRRRLAETATQNPQVVATNVPSAAGSSHQLPPPSATLEGSPTVPSPNQAAGSRPLFINAGTPTVDMRVQVSTCCVCFERPITSFLQPCGHTFCTVCAVQVQEISSRCPMCRGSVQAVKVLQFGN